MSTSYISLTCFKIEEGMINHSKGGLNVTILKSNFMTEMGEEGWREGMNKNCTYFQTTLAPLQATKETMKNSKT